MAIPITDMAKVAAELVDQATVDEHGIGEITVSPSQIGDLIEAVCARLNTLGVDKRFSLKRRDTEFPGRNIDYNPGAINARMVLHLYKRARGLLKSTLTP